MGCAAQPVPFVAYGKYLLQYCTDGGCWLVVFLNFRCYGILHQGTLSTTLYSRHLGTVYRSE